MSETLHPSIIKAAFAAAVQNPGLMIRCPWCGEAVVGEKFDNHSHLHAKVKEGMTAIILAGGRGTRLEPWPAPKCLLPINGEMIIHRLLEHLLNVHRQYVSRAVICVGYRAGDIERAVGISGGSVTFSNAGEEASMGERLLQVGREVKGRQRVLICYADDLADVDIAALVKLHEDERAVLTFASAIQKVGGGVLALDGHELIHEDHVVAVNIGFVVVEPECWAFLQPEDGLSGWINKVERETNNVSVYSHKGRRATVNTLADLKAAEEIWK